MNNKSIENDSDQSWLDNLAVYIDKRSLTMLALGFSAGLPLLLIFSTLSLWLREAGVERAEVTFFSWAALGYSFKFIWAPLIDRLPLPYLSRLLGRRRSWLLLSQLSIIMAILWMAFTDPAKTELNLVIMAIGAVLLGFSSATQDIVIDAFRIESAESKMQAALSASYIAGYRVAMISAGAGALYLAAYFGTSIKDYYYDAWMWTYIIMAASMLIGIITTLIRPEPSVAQKKNNYRTADYLKFIFSFLIILASFISVFIFTSSITDSSIKDLTVLLGNKAFAAIVVGAVRLLLAVGAAILSVYIIGKLRIVNIEMIKEGYYYPVQNFFQRYGLRLALLLLCLIGSYRMSDIVLSVISNVFFQDMGYTKPQIATVVKTFGLIMTIAGGFLGGIFSKKYGVYKTLLWGAILTAFTNLIFMILAKMGPNIYMLYVVISLDNLAGGLASAAFVAFLSSLTDVSFTAVQYAIFSSLMTIIPKLFGGYSGTIVDAVGYPNFFLIVAILGIPAIILAFFCKQNFKIK